MRVSFQATAGNLARSSGEANFYVGLEDVDNGGRGILQRITLLDATNTSVPLSGTNLGSECGRVVFESGSGSSFNTARPPYNGSFAPNANTIRSDGDLGPPSTNSGSFRDFVGVSVGTNWNLTFHDIPCVTGAPVVIQCWRLQLRLRNRGATRNAPSADDF